MNNPIPIAESRIVNVHWKCHKHSHDPGRDDDKVSAGVATVGVTDGFVDGMEPVHTDANHTVDRGGTQKYICCHPSLIPKENLR